MTITLNGDTTALDGPTTVADLVAAQPRRSMAVAVNGAVVPLSAHAATFVNDGDVVEIVTAVAGG
ncbi:MAG TPA: sulfur carrier protein ThiS [Aeromicrobium sp.]|nr:sulfur carrier protein ThiS [Aeromicrobium sp.]HKY57411.1 sulfur carrier protein ThiS [Aeromicrobium sp.]